MIKNSIIPHGFIPFLLCALCLCLSACAPSSSGTGVADNFLHPPTKAPTPTLYPPKEIDLNGILDAQGRAVSPISLESPDGCMRLEIDQGTSILTSSGKPASRLVIQQDYPGKLPVEAYGVSVSCAYRFGPEELRFSNPAKIVFTCLKNYKKTMVSETSLGIQGDDGKWNQQSVQGDEQTIWSRLDSLLTGTGYLLVGPAPMGS